MTPLEWMATIFGAAIVLKILFILINPKGLQNFRDECFKVMEKNRLIITVILLVLAYFTGTYVFEAFSIVNIAAIMLFFMILLAIGIVPFAKEFRTWSKALYKKDILSKAWLAILIWAAFGVYTLYILFV